MLNLNAQLRAINFSQIGQKQGDMWAALNHMNVLNASHVPCVLVYLDYYFLLYAFIIV